MRTPQERVFAVRGGQRGHFLIVSYLRVRGHDLFQGIGSMRGSANDRVDGTAGPERARCRTSSGAMRRNADHCADVIRGAPPGATNARCVASDETKASGASPLLGIKSGLVAGMSQVATTLMSV